MLGLSLFCCLQMGLTDVFLYGTWVLQEWTIGDARQSLIQNAAIGTKVGFDGKKIAFGPNAVNSCKYHVIPFSELAIDLIDNNEGERIMGVIIPDREGIRLVFPIQDKAARPTKQQYNLSSKSYWSIYLTKTK